MSGLVTGLPRWLSGKRILLAVQGMQVGSLGQEDPLEEEMATHSSIAWKNHMDRGALWALVRGTAKTRMPRSTQAANSCVLLP